MKKIVFLASLMCATMVMAAPSITSTSQIDLSTAGQTDKYVRFVLSSSFSDAFDNTWDTPAPNESGIYVLYNSERFTGWASNQYSENLALGFYTGENTSYTLKFSNFKGESYEIYDRVENKMITVNASTEDYNFTIDESQKNSQINDRFVINIKVDPSLCFNYNVLEINGHAGESLVVKKGETELVNEASLPLLYSKDLSDQKGRLVVTLNGKDFQIDANPDVTPAN